MAPKARKRQSRLDIPSPAPSSGDEEDSSEELSVKEELDNHFEEEEEDADDQITASKTTNPVPDPTINLASVSKSESGSDSDADSDQSQPSPGASDFTVNPIASEQPRNPRLSLKPSIAGKRAAEAEPSGGRTKDKKKKKKKDSPNGNSGGSQRVWSYDDEAKILKGMIEFRSKKGADPSANMVGFYEFVKSLLQLDASKVQLIDKIRRLKKKYQISAAKGPNGEDPVFSKPQEHKLFDLAKKIWGPGAGVVENGVNGSKKQKKSAVEEVKNESNKVKEEGTAQAREHSFHDQMEEDNKPGCGPGDFWAQHPFLKASIDTGMFAPKLSAEKWMSILGKEKAKHFEQELKSLRKAELDQLNRKLNVMREVIGGIVSSAVNIP